MRGKAILSAVLAAVALLGGCGEGPPQYVVVTGSTTGVYYQVGQAVDAMVRRNGDDVRLGVRASGGSVDNARQLAADRADFALMQSDIAAFALEGAYMFQGQPITNIRGVAALYPEHVHLVVRADSGIATVADLAGKAVAIGDAGSGTEANALQILGAHGLSESDLGRVERLGASQSAGRMQDGHVQAMFYTVGVGAAAVQELATQMELAFIGIEGDAREALLRDHGYYTAATIPADAYGPGRPAASVPTVAVTAMLVARQEVPDEAVQAVLASIFDHIDAFRARHARLGQVDAATARAGLTIPLHPAAQAFYENPGEP
jgi:uncharacterized protein